MCSILLDAEGGAKRQPWRDGPVLVRDAMDETYSAPAECEIRSTPAQPDVEGVIFGGPHGAVKRKYQASTPSPVRTEDQQEWFFTQEVHERLNREAHMRNGREKVCYWETNEEWVEPL